MDDLEKCRNEVRRLIGVTAYCRLDKKQKMKVATYGKLSEFERMLRKLILVLLLVALNKDNTS